MRARARSGRLRRDRLSMTSRWPARRATLRGCSFRRAASLAGRWSSWTWARAKYTARPMKQRGQGTNAFGCTCFTRERRAPRSRLPPMCSVRLPSVPTLRRNPRMPGLVAQLPEQLRARWETSCGPLSERARFSLARHGVDVSVLELAREQCELPPEPEVPTAPLPPGP